MISNLFNKFLIKIIILIFFICLTFNSQNANEILIYADQIYYDEKNNLIGKGKAKILFENQIIKSDLIIYNEKSRKITIPTEFSYKDKNNNLFYGSEGFFKNDFTSGSIDNVKILLNDGSRIVGNKFNRDKNIDIISKGVYSPCTSRIKIANFICPTWQLEGEKILHDNNNLLLYQKHSKMRVLNLPVFYLPYIVTPSPLRKKRKSGFLSPSLNFNFFDTKVSQSTSLPYYFNIAEDKELTFTPTFNYGGGVDSSQRFMFEYNQKISGGNFSTDLTFDSTFEEKNNNKWLNDASLITNYNKNLNNKFNINFESAIETSKNYIQSTKPSNNLSYLSSLSTKIDLHGYYLNKIDDRLLINITNYQTNQNNDDNSSLPTVLPFVNYDTGKYQFKKYSYNNYFQFYNIIRDKKTDNNAKEQQKISHKLNFTRSFQKFFSNIYFEGEVYNQLFNTTKKTVNSSSYSGSNFRLFPIFAIKVETPFKLKKNLFNLTYTPNLSLIVSPGKSNSDRISNEDSSLNTLNSTNEISLNRYSGSDKLDNSKRLVYSINLSNNIFSSNFSQTYEFTDNSNFHNDIGNSNNLGDLLNETSYETDNSKLQYNFRYDHSNRYLKNQNITFTNNNRLGNIELSYLDQKSKSDTIIEEDIETLNYVFKTKKFNKFSSVGLSGLYNLKTSINTEYGINYSYFDECFGINVDFKRNSYKEDNLKPQDTLTIMFSFKNIGSYRSSNLAVSENDKQDISWESGSVENELFN
mgnify:CR=1 FL=1|tara:strand:+ start:4698 stop:6944 length:2247 start_codon:yes stop_codon:yes gene_type:complete